MSIERFEHRPTEFVSVHAGSGLVYVGIASREDFDNIAAPVCDHGENEKGHVLTKWVQAPGDNGAIVIFQYWLKSRTVASLLADKAPREVSI
ncbi:MAG: hypothetical protein WDM91_11140 [Rhizomicrobium sp.]